MRKDDDNSCNKRKDKRCICAFARGRMTHAETRKKEEWVKRNELKAEIRNGNMELKDLMNSFNAEEMKAEVTNGNMELRAMLTDLINTNTKRENSGQKDSTQTADTTSNEDEDSQYMHYQGKTEHEHSEDDDAEEDSRDRCDIHDEEDNIQEMAQTQIIGPDEQNESYEEDYTDDNDESKISLETCRLHYLTCKEQLYEIINCQDISCERENHARHHDFITNPLNIYQRERVTVGFGMNVIKQRAMEYVHDNLFNDLLCNTGRDPKCRMDLNRDIFIKLTVPNRWKGDLEDENLLVSLKCTAALSDLSEETFVRE
ncbi:Hypothetical predicted protein [Mytilus galloprovincialis]|uniref:Uncharacterized protein n=1 Tax=Mytilus galloprovincialis TaxID=29158 RepID=A0A8B6H1J6_MYTGA|nr:Hypothetical predicted protein [Mytilus galloprovincialis]